MLFDKKIEKTLEKLIPITFIMLTGICLIGLQLKPWGWILWLLGIASLAIAEKKFIKDMLIIYIALGLLGITPITTDVSYLHMLMMGITLFLAIALPYYVSKFIYKDNSITFKWNLKKRWTKKQWFYLLFALVASYLIIPFYLKNTGAYINWSVEPGISFISRLFAGTNSLGIWDELFFVSTVLGLLRKHIKFIWANLVQAVLFTSFLFELGFTGWGPLMIYPFALLQGYVFKKTDSLLYIVAIHLTIDLILFLALIYLHYPTWMPIFFV